MAAYANTFPKHEDENILVATFQVRGGEHKQLAQPVHSSKLI